MIAHPLKGIILIVLLAITPSVRAADAVTDAKRRAASELMRDGKVAEAIALTQEVVKADAANYRDHLLLARAYDKMNKTAEAVVSYRRVLELLGPTDDRAVRVEAERRLKVLDLQTAKIQAAEDEFLKKLDALEREAIAAKDVAAVRRIFRLKAGCYKAAGRTDRAGVEITAVEPWQDGGISLIAGRTYRIRAAGIFQLHAGVDCSADGSSVYPENVHGPMGMLIGKLEGDPTWKLGSSGRIKAERTGRLYLLLNGTMPEKTDSSGSVTVLIEQE